MNAKAQIPFSPIPTQWDLFDQASSKKEARGNSLWVMFCMSAALVMSLIGSPSASASGVISSTPNQAGRFPASIQSQNYNHKIYAQKSKSEKTKAKTKLKKRLSVASISLVSPIKLYAKGLDASSIQPITSSRTVDQEDVARVIPTNITPSSDTGEVASRILGHSLENLAQNEVIQNSAVGQSAMKSMAKIEKAFASDLKFGSKEADKTYSEEGPDSQQAMPSDRTDEANVQSSNGDPTSQSDSIEHSFKFGMQALQSRAKIEYQGLTRAEVSYLIGRDQLDFEIRERLPILKTDLVYNHTINRDEKVDKVLMRWSW